MRATARVTATGGHSPAGAGARSAPAPVDGDPVARISDVRKTALVVKNGVVYRPAELYRALGIRP